MNQCYRILKNTSRMYQLLLFARKQCVQVIYISVQKMITFRIYVEMFWVMSAQGQYHLNVKVMWKEGRNGFRTLFIL